MPKRLYVDSFNEDKSMAITTNKSSVSYNLTTLNKLNEKSSPAFTVGKYICIVWTTNPPSLTFLDLRKNPDLAKDIVNSPQLNELLKQKFISLIETYNSTYDSNPDDVEYILGEPRTKPF